MQTEETQLSIHSHKRGKGKEEKKKHQIGVFRMTIGTGRNMNRRV
jgi:hypothetical protein